MKKAALVLFLLITVLSIWSVSAEQILSSNDVVAYVLDEQLYLMDINSGKELKVKTTTETSDLIWGKSGQNLYRLYYYMEDGPEPMKTHISLYEVKLPSLQDSKLHEFVIEDSELTLVRLGLHEDGSIFILYTITWTNEEGKKHSLEKTHGYYSISQMKYYPFSEEKPYFATLYQDPLHAPKSFKGFSIEDKIVIDPLYGNHYELYAISKDKEEAATDPDKVDTVQLTKYFVSGYRGLTHLHHKKQDYALSPDTKNILASYHYYYSDEKSDYCQTFIHSLKDEYRQYETVVRELYDEENKKWVPTRQNALKVQYSLQIGSSIGMTNSNWYEWTKDGRMVYCTEVDGADEKMKICVTSNLLLEKVLKTYKGYSTAKLFYRYTE
jgi:hypothetical protein